MQGRLQKRGQYELFETAKGHQILNLNNQEFYAVVEGQKGDILVRSDSDHKKKKTLRKGKFYLTDFENDPEFNDIPHLFLQEGDSQYREWILPQGAPSKSDHQKKLVRASARVGEDKVKKHTRKNDSNGSRRHSDGSDRENLESKNKNELYELAKQASISGRSNMDKRELVKALRSAK